ncbi:MAG: hypothetical protein GX606_06375 [Elusimicrobia bacterium]|nr:hypothetical protein [Elusimicrobiota bacterium]
MHSLETLALIASIVMPLWNIPLILRIIRRRSSEDLSLAWFLGVWGCMLVMLPWGLVTTDKVLKVFSIVNLTLFSVVGIVMFKYRNGSK